VIVLPPGDGKGAPDAALVSVWERPRPPASHPTPEGAAETVLEAAGLTREFGGVRAVDDVSLQVRRGMLTGLIGPNGAGKSTLLAMLAGTLPASAGKVIYRGQDITGVPAFRRAARAGPHVSAGQ
jgi:branched-chain amino acid transport system permease protein